MKKACILVSGCVIGLMFVMGVHAQATPAGQSDSGAVKDRSAQSPVKSNPEGKRFVGTVASVDLPGKVLVVKNWRGETVFDTSSARFARNAKLEDLRPGERVLVRYVEEEGRKVARAVITAQSKPEKETNPGAVDEAGKTTVSPEKK